MRVGFCRWLFCSVPSHLSHGCCRLLLCFQSLVFPCVASTLLTVVILPGFIFLGVFANFSRDFANYSLPQPIKLLGLN